MQKERLVFGFLLAYFVVVNLIDFVTTIMIIANGGYEMNFLIVYLDSIMPTAFTWSLFIVKIFFIGFIILLFANIFDNYKDLRNKLLLIMLIINSCYLLVIAHNLSVLMSMGVL